jgi:hypothetical protein
MKRWLCSLWLAVGVMFLLWMPHRCVRPQLHPQDQSVLSQKEFVSTWSRALRATSPAFIQSRVGPLEFFATKFGLSVVAITRDDGPPWLDSRGPPGPETRNQDSAASLQGCWPSRQPKGEALSNKIPCLQRQIQHTRFCNTL